MWGDLQMSFAHCLCLSVWAIYSLGYLSYRFSSVTAGALAVIALVWSCPFFQNSLEKKVSYISDAALWSLAFLLSLATLTGFYFDHNLPFEDMAFLDFSAFALCVMGITPLFKCMFAELYLWVQRFAEEQQWLSPADLPKKPVVNWFFAFFIIFFCWFLVWLAYYPGLWNYDAGQARQYLTGSYDKKHPLIHIVFLGAFYAFGVKGGNPNIGLALYDLLQMASMAGIFACAYTYIANRIQSKVFRGCTLLFFALFPVNSIMAISATKDVQFSGLLLLCLVLGAHYMEAPLRTAEKRTALQKWLGTAFLMVCIVLMLLFRNNAIHAFYLFILLAIVLFLRHQLKREVILLLICCAALFKLGDVGLTWVLSASPGPIREIMSLPSQQFGRIYEKTDDLDAKRFIQAYYELDGKRSYYNPCLADPMNMGFKPDGLTREQFLAIAEGSLKLLLKYPLLTLDSFLYTTKGHWYLDDISHAYIYARQRGDIRKQRLGYLQTRVWGTYGIEHRTQIPALEAFIERIVSWNEHQHWPVLSLLFAPALYCWILLFCTVGFVATRRWNYLFLSSYLWFYLVSLMAAACVLVRLSYPFFVCAPVLLCMLVRAVQEHSQEAHKIQEDTL